MAKPVIKPRKRAGSFETFVKIYEPLELPDGLIMREWDQIPPNVEAFYIWTVVEGDNNKVYVVPGVSIVNRIGYIWCAVPWDDTEYANPGYLF